MGGKHNVKMERLETRTTSRRMIEKILEQKEEEISITRTKKYLFHFNF